MSISYDKRNKRWRFEFDRYIKSIVRTVRNTRGHRQNTARNPLEVRFLHSGGQKSPHT